VACTGETNVITVTVNNVNGGVIGSDQTVCNGGNPAALSSTLDGTGDGAITYQWQDSPDNTTFTDIPAATQVIYDPGAIVQTTYYKRITTSTLNGTPCTDESNVITISVNNVAGGTIAADQTICIVDDPAAFTSTVDGSGDGVITYQWQSSTDNVTFADIGGALLSTYDAGVLAQTMYYKRITTSTLNGKDCEAESNVVTVTVNDVDEGTIGSDQTICNGGDPAVLTSVVDGTGSGAIGYQWQDSPDNATFTDIGGAIAATYDPGVLLATTYYKRITTSTLTGTPCSAESNVITITVNDVDGGTIATDQTICNGDDPVAFTGTVDGTGSGVVTIQWQSSTDNIIFSDIGGATATTYDAPVLIQTMYYKRVTTSELNGKNCDAGSNVVTVTVNDVAGGTVAADQTICSGDDPVAFTSSVDGSGDGVVTYQWQDSPDNVTFTNIVGATLNTYDPGVLVVTTYYKRITNSALNGKDCTAESNVVTVTVNDVAGGTVATDQTICNGDIPAGLTSTVDGSGDGIVNYQWQDSPDNITFTNIAGATFSVYSPGALVATTYYKRVITSTLNGTPCTDESNVITITVNDVTGGTIAADQTICNGDDPVAFTSTIDGTGSGAVTIQWQDSPDNLSFSDIGGATATTYDAPVLTQTMYYKRITTSSLNGKDCDAETNVVTVMVNDVAGGTIGSDQAVCGGDDPAAFTSVVDGTGDGAVTFQWHDSPDNLTFTDIGGATLTTYDPGVLAATTYFKRITTSTQNGIPCIAESNVVTVTVNNVAGGTIAADQTICNGDDPAAFTSSVDGSGSGVVTFQWQSSIDNVIFSDIGGATLSTYDAGVLTRTMYFKRVTTSVLIGKVCTDESNVVTVTVNDVDGGTVTADQTICNGDDPAAFISTLDGSGDGVIVFQWQDSPDNVTFTDIGGATLTTYDPGVLVTTTYYRRVTTSTLNGKDCTAESNVITVTVNDVAGGTIGSDQTICNGDNPIGLISTINGSGDGAITYQWQDSPDNAIFTDIAGAVFPTYTPGALVQTTYYKRVTTSTLNGTPCTDESNVVTITVNDVAGGTIAADQTICNGDDPAAFTSTVDGTGSGVVTFQWQSSTNNLVFTDIGGETNLTYDASVLIQTMYYKRITTSTLNGKDCEAETNVVTITVNDVDGGTIGSDQTVCGGDDPAALVSIVNGTGSGVVTYQWQDSPDNATFTDIGGETIVTYDPGVLAATTYFKRITTSTQNGIPCTDESNVVTVSVNNVDGGTIAADQTICSGDDPVAFTSTVDGTGTGVVTIQWQSSTDNIIFSDIGGASATTYDAPALIQTKYYKRVTTTVLNGKVCTAESNTLTITVNDVDGGTVAADQTICNGDDPAAFTSTVNGTGDGVITFQWQDSPDNVTFTDIGGATALTYDAGIPVATTYYRRVTTSTLNGKDCTAESNVITVTVNNVAGGTIATNQTICNGDIPAGLSSTVDGSGDGAITYQWQDSPDNATFTNIVGATFSVYSPGALVATTYYKRVTTSTLNGTPCTSETNVITITVNDVAGGTIAADQTICNGDDPAAFTSTVDGSGGGVITYQWQSSTDNLSFSDIGGATFSTWDAGVLTQTMYYKRITTSTLNAKDCDAESNVVTVTVNDVAGGTIGSDQTICSGEDPAAFINIVGGSGDGIVTYQWQDSPDNAIFTDIGGATLATYDPGIPAATIYYKRVTTSTLNGTPCTDETNVVTVTINDVNGGTIAADQTICNGDDLVTFTSSVDGTGSGVITFQWQSSTDNITFNNIPGETAVTYDAGALTLTMYYKRITTSVLNGKVCTAESNVLTVTVNDVDGGTVAADQTICNGDNPAAFTSILDGTGDGVITYQWQDSPDNVTYTNIGGATATTYDPGVLVTTTYYKRVTNSALNGKDCTAESNVITVTVNDVAGGTVAADQTICNGDNPVGLTSTVDGSGDGAITYRWQDSPDNTTWTNIAGATFSTYVPGALVATTYYKRVTISTLNGTPCTAESNAITITVNDVDGGTIAANQTICNGDNPVAFTSTVAGTGDGVITYQWQSSTNNLVFTDIGGATLSTYDAGVLAQTMYYKRITTSTLNGKDCTAGSNVVTVTVNDVAGGTVGSDQTICNGDDPVAFTNLVAGSGDGAIGYQWQDSPDNATFTDIVGATLVTYDPGVLVATTYYKRVTTSTLNGTPCTAESNVVTITVNDVAGGTIAADETICNGENPIVFTSTVDGSGDGVVTQQWQSSTDNVTFSPIGGATSVTYDAPALTQTMYYKRVTTSLLNGTQCTAESNVVTVTVNDVSGGTVAADQTICNGDDPAAFTSTVDGSGDGVIGFQWQDSPDNITFTDIVGATLNTYDPGVLVVTTYYKRVTTSTLNGKDCTDESNVVTVTVNDVAGGTIAADQTICNGDDAAAFTSTVNGSGDGTISYQWQDSPDNVTFTNIAGAIAANYDPGVLVATTYYKRVTTSTLNGKDCTAESNVVTITVNDVDGGTIAADETICNGDDPVAFTSTVAGTGDGVITYQWQSSTNNLVFTDIGGATAITYDEGFLTQTMYYKRITTSTLNGKDCAAESNVVTVTVNDVSGGAVGSDNTICGGDDPAVITNIISGSGDGVVTYQWQDSPDNATFTNIVGATLATYDPGVLAATTYYKRVTNSALNGKDCTAESNVVTVTVNVVDGGTIAADQTICNGDDPAAFTSTVDGTGNGTISIQWHGSTDNITFLPIGGATATTYDAPVLTQTMYYKRVTSSVLNGKLCTAESNVITVTVNNVAGGVIAANQTICSGNVPAAFTSTVDGSGDGVIGFQWQDSPDNVTFTDIVGATLTTYDPGAVIVTTYYKRITTSALNGKDCTAESNVLTITINPVPVILAGQVKTICSGEPVNHEVLLNPVNTPAGTRFNWAAPTMSDASVQGSAGVNVAADPAGTIHITDALENKTGGAITATYTITPTSSIGCDGTPVDVVITIDPEPILDPALNMSICSDVASGLVLDVSAGSVAASGYNISNINVPAGLTPDGANAGTGTGLADNVLAGDIFTNTTGISLTVVYNVVPVSADDCEGDMVQVTLTVNPEPVLNASLDKTACSDVASGLTLSVAIGSVAASEYNVSNINVASGLVPDAGNVGTGTGLASNALAGDIFTNITSAPLTVVYDVVPVSAAGCVGDMVQVTLTVNPEPILAAGLDNTVCSDNASGITLTTAGGSVAASTYDIFLNSMGSGLTGTATTGIGLAANAIVGDIFTNKTGGALTVVYNITPISADGCRGDQQQVTLTVDPEPVLATNLDDIACSDVASGLILDVASGSVAAATYNITNISVSGGLTPDGGNAIVANGLSANAIAGDIFTNTTAGALTVVYDIVPVSAASCVGDMVQVTISVNPEPILDPGLDDSNCSGEAIGVILGVDIGSAPAATYNINNINVAAGLVPDAGNTTTGNGQLSDAIANDKFVNPTTGALNVVYDIVPVTSSGCEGDMVQVTFSVNLAPALDPNLDATVCSDDVSGIVFDVAAGSVPASHYDITNIDIAAGLSADAGNATAGNGKPADAIALDKFTNTTSVSRDVVYDVVPVPVPGCLGETVQVTLTVNPEPVLDPALSTTICSDEISGITLAVGLGSVAAADYNITNINTAGGLVAGGGNAIVANGVASDAIVNDLFTNTTTAPLLVVYDVVPVSAAGCEGETVQFTLTVYPEPVLASGLDNTVCSDENSGIAFSVATGSVGANSYDITNITVPAALTADAMNTTAGTNLPSSKIIGDKFTNTTGSALTVVYSVVPVSSAGCAGDTVQISLTVNPEPVFDPALDATVCSDESGGIVFGVVASSVAAANYNINSINIAAGLVPDGSNSGAGNAKPANAVANDIFTNQTSTALTVTYNVAPVSSDGCVGESVQIILTVDPEPELSYALNKNECSDVETGIVLSVAGSSVAAASYNIELITIDANLTADAANATVGTGLSADAIQHDIFTNKSSLAATVVYDIVPVSAAGCAGDMKQITHTVYPEPVMTSGLTETVCSGSYTSLALSITNSVAGTNFNWVVPVNTGGMTGGTAGPSTYISDIFDNTSGSTQTATYKVVPVSGFGCIGDTTDVVITVNSNPVADISGADTLLVCGGQDLQLDGNPTGGSGTYSSHLWSGMVGPLDNSSIQTPIFNYSLNGEFNLTYTVIDDNGCQGSDTVVIVNDNPNALFGVDESSSCSPHTATFTNNSMNAISYEWTFGDGSPFETTTDPSHEFVNQTISIQYYSVKLVTQSVNGCRDSMTQVITVYPVVDSEFSITPDTVCHGETATMAAQPGGSTYFWDYGDGDSEYTGNVANHVFRNTTTAPVTYTIVLTAESFYSCSSQSQKEVVVYPSPVAAFIATPANQVFPNATVTITDLTNSGTWDYLWDFGDSTTSVEASPAHTYNYPGTYKISMTVSNDKCSDEASGYITITPTPPVAGFDEVESGCMPWTIQFNNTSLWADTYLWNFGDGSISNSENPEYTYFGAGYYTVRLTVTGPGGTDEYVQDIEVYQMPVADFSFVPKLVYVNDQPVKCLNRSMYGDSYLWEFGDGQTDTIYEPHHIYAAEGEYYITLTVYTDNGCEDTRLADNPVTVEPAGEVRYPTAFRPNMNNEGSDGGQDVSNIPATEINQYFFPPVQEKVDDYHLQIFNRWGEMIFETDDINIGWTGYYKGTLCKQDVYVWLVEGKYSNGKPFKKAGDITLLY